MLFHEGGGFDYNTVFRQMTPYQIDEANAALDLMIEARERAIEEAKNANKR